ncbi:MAG: hypothetical protein AAGE13_10615, partial [Pseudomonadota bacterium]
PIHAPKISLDIGSPPFCCCTCEDDAATDRECKNKFGIVGVYDCEICLHEDDRVGGWFEIEER